MTHAPMPQPRRRFRHAGTALVAAMLVVVTACSGSSSSEADESGVKPQVEIPVEPTGSFTDSEVACDGIALFPSPDTTTAAPTSQISFQQVDAATITDGSITVTGSSTGDHTGEIVANSDGEGASFRPTEPFEAGETVTVTAPEQICGAEGSTASFTVATDEIAPLPEPDEPPSPRPQTSDDELQHFLSQPDLAPPALEVTRPDLSDDGTPRGEGLYFLGAKGGTIDGGPMIIDAAGELVWHLPMPEGVQVADVRVQQYQGEPVLTWWQGAIDRGNGKGTGVIVDRSYATVAEVEAANGYAADMHEFLLDDDGTAWMTIYHTAPGDLSDLDGPANAAVIDSIVQQVDIPTGNVLFEWHSLDHVDPAVSAVDYDADSDRPYDYFHVNAIDPGGEGTILITARNTNALYLLNRASGEVIWTLGGEASSFAMGEGTDSVFHHDGRLHGDRFVTIFDNQTKDIPARLIALELDLEADRASLVWEHTAPGDLPAVAQGGLQLLEGGNLVAGWGSANLEGPADRTTTITEYASDGAVLFHVAFLGEGINSYRAYRMPWTATPTSDPAATVTDDDGGATVAVAWNGATEVARWELVSSADDEVLATADRAGFETRIEVDDLPAGVVVRALDADGAVLGSVPLDG